MKPELSHAVKGMGQIKLITSISRALQSTYPACCIYIYLRAAGAALICIMCLLTTLCAERWQQTDDGLHRSMIWAWAPVFTLCRCNKWRRLLMLSNLCAWAESTWPAEWVWLVYHGHVEWKCMICSTCEPCSAIRSIQRPLSHRFYHRHVEQKMHNL